MLKNNKVLGDGFKKFSYLKKNAYTILDATHASHTITTPITERETIMSDSWNQGQQGPYGSQPPTPPPGWGAPPPGYGAPAPQPAYGVPMSADHPEGVKALIISIIALLCCGPLAIWSFIISKNAKAEGSTDTKITVAYVLSIIALVWLAIQVILIILSVATGGFTVTTGTDTYNNF